MAEDWNARQYLKFEDERTRPARDLLSHVPLAEAAFAVDLGCGPGNSTELVAQRFPGADVLGIDTSPAMLEAARTRLPQARFAAGDASSFTLDRPADLIFANAVLQWVPHHARLFPRLLSLLAPGGVLAVQMPDNLDQPSHVAMRETALDGPWAGKLAEAVGARTELPSAGEYYNLLIADAGQSGAAQVDIWRTTYYHPLDGHGAIVEWLKSTGLRPFLDPLDAAERVEFLAAYQARLAAAYPPRVDGTALLAFPRLFLIARR
ncbi:MAG TPA: trans-aconitate 2-methyltransferase [Xanthobacteraceae bacterium]|jgi:trans-aconitate 2-methyltransferase|nr:MAG: trans-aconitate 2-methyltransferase [Rhizobiales bacterium 39-66-18]HQS50204.1 trans-aconitate 2-methyltransferase [Xanthobacteraceae bacterium]